MKLRTLPLYAFATFVVAFPVLLVGCKVTDCHTDNSTKTEVENIGDPAWPKRLPKGPVDFKAHVRPILIINCMECHDREHAPKNGGIILETRADAMRSNLRGPVLVPGKPDESRLLTVLKLDGIHFNSMPPAPDKIFGVRYELIERWIKEGAVWPEDVQLVHPYNLKDGW